ncbi:Elongin-A [Candida viswanathii]|uniref:Elongin-A n=1 Tax=Candida viswanathii TaxID=5486 RepID=A0A367Y4P2_9ASCO|nr:Elongin-A [Candida viswanathii]
MESQFNTKKPRTLPTLSQLAIAKLRRHAAQIADVGNTPFHLLEPILQQMPSRQLNELEENCRQLLPYSDKLWLKLIAKDFPDRPVKIDPLQAASAAKSNSMPYKTLYYKYCKDRDDFRKDSAKKLRNANKSLEKEKSKRKIIAVDQVLRDPTIRKTNYTSNNGFTKTMQPVNKNSILEKAKRDTAQSRNLIFARNHHLKAYDPFQAFKVNSRNTGTDFIRAPRVPNVRRTTFFNATSESLKSPTSENAPSVKRTPASAPKKTPTDQLPQQPPSPVKPSITAQKSSIFIQRKRKSPPPVSSSATPKRVKKPVQPKEPRSKIKQLKSSIFS